MARAFAAIRPDERRDSWAAFLTLFGFIASHSVLETARDALFLSKVPASRLPWMYLAIAVLSLGVARGQSLLGRMLQGRKAVAAWTLVAAAITFGFWALMPSLGAAGLYGLYLWSGVLTSLVLVHFWTLLGDLFSVTQAKRLYGFIGAGSVLGAIAGSAAASALARALPAGRLLLVAACGFLVTAALPSLFRAPATHPAAAGAPAPDASGLVENARYVLQKPYIRTVAWLLIASAGALTVADYLFKSTVAATIPKEQLGTYFATVYLVLNVLSLGAQLLLVGWVIRRFDLSTALAILPALLLLGAFGIVLGGGLAAALLIKGADGSLRYSLHRTSTELLFVPLSDEARRRVKAFIDVAGQRGGQVVASLGILLAAALGAPPAVLAGALVLMAGAWFAGAVQLRRHYLDIFRRRLRQGRVEHLQFPELDVASLETLVAALDSRNDAEVLAALEVLEREGKARLVPALILYHPSEAVVIRALTLFCQGGRTNILHVADRLLDHASARVRSAALAARAILAPDPKLLNLRLSLEESPEVRATIVMHLILSGELVGAEAQDRLDTLLRRGSVESRAALADTIALRGAPGFDHVVLALARAAEPEVRLAAARAVARLKAPSLIPALLDLLADERTRPTARAALVDQGGLGFAALEGALRADALPQAVRWELPRAIALFDPQQAGSLLLDHLVAERDGMVRYRSIRALEGLVARHPTLVLDRAALDRAIESTVSRAYRYLDRRLSLERGKRAVPERATPGHDLLVKMLKDKEDNAVGRLFRLLGLQYPTEDFAQIYRGLRSTLKNARASSVELVENLLEPSLRGAVLGLIDDVADEDRLTASGKFHEPVRLGYDELLQRMLESTSEALQDLTVFHIGELRLQGFRERIEHLPNPSGARADVTRTLELLGGVPAPEAAAC